MIEDIELRRVAVRKYLTSLEWDGKPRIARALGEGRSMEHAATLARGSELFFRTAVQRAFEPGCVVDQSLVIVAPEGAGKTTWARALGGEHYGVITDLVAQAHGRGVKHIQMAATSSWIIEADAPDADSEKLKMYLTSTEDVYRPPYGRNFVNVPRACVFVFTMCAADDALLGSRRFFVVETDRVPDPTPVRDQLWAEAVAAYENSKRSGAAS